MENGLRRGTPKKQLLARIVLTPHNVDGPEPSISALSFVVSIGQQCCHPMDEWHGAGRDATQSDSCSAVDDLYCVV